MGGVNKKMVSRKRRAKLNAVPLRIIGVGLANKLQIKERKRCRIKLFGRISRIIQQSARAMIHRRQ